ncbi:Peptidoglycan/LPS O-acetylase OafA/YrhL, contains acyltransferase and SGNH-hydrolase domains [Nocardia amikacinitolerans]|uniref:Peptidoglycan/LPS O-acetylase OafA/YrhL, contains acyltransferase and SGNH-hydrolase domains n=2 Tax=Nocardia amikacinitolerans TaxID=756689 RepID=A0A285L7X5_9NOCA|nr:Peptidoglycan/LPS O-acetylase OafA/YrhL, contains acyltransferase and SGNH-hydrolase domains [Nocardia amikacinitolerans]
MFTVCLPGGHQRPRRAGPAPVDASMRPPEGASQAVGSGEVEDRRGGSAITAGAVGRRPAPGRTIEPGEGRRRPERKHAYRHDLDGLRGVAIALVVVFHIWLGRVSGGVDVFLVLSGFFFTGSLLRRAESTGTVAFGATARRLGRRLLPGLVLVLAVVAIGTVLIRPYTQWTESAAQTLASLLYYQNWYLALSWSDYLAADPSVSPLQHLWSMSVQGQFYLVALAGIALLVAVVRKFGLASALRPTVAVVFGGLAVASFVYAARGAELHQGWNYYDSLARGWELLAGALLAVLAPKLAVPRALRVVLAVAGALVVLGCGWLTNGANEFPGPAALIPVGAAVALILSGAGLPTAAQPLPNRLLAAAPMVRLGELAYALYLWHWPILIFVLAERGTPTAGIEGGLAVLAASCTLAYLTHRFVEEPLRTGAVTRRADYRRRAGRTVAVVGATLLAVAVGAQVVTRMLPPQPVAHLDPTRYPGAEALAAGAAVPRAKMRPTVFEAPADAAYPSRDKCIADWDTRDVITCTYGDADAERTIAVVGSSHAEHWVPALDVLAREHGFRITVYLKMGCPLTVAAEPMYKGEPIPDCRDWSAEVIDRLGVDRPQWVFTTGTRPRDRTGDETPTDYLEVWSRLAEHGLNVLAVRDTPWLRRDGIRYRAIDCLAQSGDGVSCGMRRTDALDEVNPAAEPAASFPNVFPIDLTDALCTPEVCPVIEGNILVYHDEHHLTASYSRSLAPELGRRLAPILGWW